MAGKSYKKLITNSKGAESASTEIIATNPLGKINFGAQWTFDAHRSGWPVVLKNISSLHNPRGLLFDGFIEQTFGWHRKETAERGEIPYTTPWMGIMHNPPNMPKFFDYLASPEVILDSQFMQESMPFCNGLFVFSDYLKQWLQPRVSCPVESLVHPTETPNTLFNFDHYQKNAEKKLIQIGFWLRKMHSLKHLEATGFSKVWIVSHDYARKMSEVEKEAINIFDENGMMQTGGYEEWDRVENFEYDFLLSQNIVFLDLYDSSANNAIVECIVRNTPVLVNKLAAVVEYLGEGYPFYFGSLEEASSKLNDEALIKETHDYLKQLDKEIFDPDYFLSKFKSSDIYCNINPLDNEQILKGATPKIDTLDDLNIAHGSPLSNDFIFVVAFRNQSRKIFRCLDTVVPHCNGSHDVGIVLIDDASEDNSLEVATKYLIDKGITFVAVQNLDRKLYARNLYNAVINLANSNKSIIIEVDGDDYLEDIDIISEIKSHYNKGARYTFGSFRIAPGSHEIPGIEQAQFPELCANLSNPWNLDRCLSWMPLKTYRRELFAQVPLVYFWDRFRENWLNTAEDLSIYPMMASIAGNDAHYIAKSLYVLDNSGIHHAQFQTDRPRYIVEKLYRVPTGGFIGESWKQTRNENAGVIQRDAIGPKVNFKITSSKSR